MSARGGTKPRRRLSHPREGVVRGAPPLRPLSDAELFASVASVDHVALRRSVAWLTAKTVRFIGRNA